MQEFIESVARRLDVSERTARAAAGAVLGLLRAHRGEAAVRLLVGGIPGATRLIEEERASAQDRPPGRGSPAPGRRAALIASVAALRASGLRADQVRGFTSALLEHGRRWVGPSAVDGTLNAIPELRTLLD